MFGIEEKLTNGTSLLTLTGDAVRVKELISDSGGQGDVYLADWNGKDYALKWYNRTEEDLVGSDQYNNIRNLTQSPNPDPARFVWPQVIVTETGKEIKGTLFGYLMELLPEGYYELKEYLRSGSDPNQKKFDSFHAMIWAGLHMVTAVHALHLQGMSYKDLNPGNLSIDPKTGRALMVDCDNISVQGAPCTVSGMRGYMAPEIVRSGYQVLPDIQTDQFSEAILLFRLFFFDHPFEGKLWNKYPMHNERVEDELYSIHPVYNMAKNDDRNRPDEDFAPNVISRMKVFPPILREGFENTFVNGIENPMMRTTEQAWLSYLTAARDQMIFSEFKNGVGTKERYVDFSKKETIPRMCHCLTLNGVKKGKITLYPLQSIFKNSLTGNHKEFDVRVGFVTVMQNRLVMQNVSNDVWLVHDPVSNRKYHVERGKAFPIFDGVQIKFADEPFKIVGVIDDPMK